MLLLGIVLESFAADQHPGCEMVCSTDSEHSHSLGGQSSVED